MDRIRAFANNLQIPVRTNDGVRTFGPTPRLRLYTPREGSEVLVVGLPFDAYEDEIYPFFLQAGPIYKINLLLQYNGRTRGVAFVTYLQPAVAENAVRKLNEGSIRPNHPIRVAINTRICALALQAVYSFGVEALRQLIQERIHREKEPCSRSGVYLESCINQEARTETEDYNECLSSNERYESSDATSSNDSEDSDESEGHVSYSHPTEYSDNKTDLNELEVWRGYNPDAAPATEVYECTCVPLERLKRWDYFVPTNDSAKNEVEGIDDSELWPVVKSVVNYVLDDSSNE